MYGYIYKITNKINGKLYIGKTTTTVEKRFARHIQNAKRKKPEYANIYLYNAMRKYGFENFEVEQIDSANTIDQLDKKEQYWISTLHTFIDDPECNGYNMMAGGEGGHWSEETKRKALETKRRNNSFGWTEEGKAKLSAALKGKPKSLEHRKHLSEHHRLKTTHLLYFKDGHTEICSDSVKTLAETRLNTSAIKLNRASEVGSFRCGDFFLLDLTDLFRMFNGKPTENKEKIFIDPIYKDIIDFTTLRSRYQHNQEIYNEFPKLETILTDEYKNLFEKFKKPLEELLKQLKK